jgi:hypothetical protein
MAIEATADEGVKIKHMDEIVKRYYLIKVKRWKKPVEEEKIAEMLLFAGGVENQPYDKNHFALIAGRGLMVFGGFIYPLMWLGAWGLGKTKNVCDSLKAWICSELCYVLDIKMGRPWKGIKRRVKGWVRPPHHDRNKQRYHVANIWRSTWSFS